MLSNANHTMTTTKNDSSSISLQHTNSSDSLASRGLPGQDEDVLHRQRHFSRTFAYKNNNNGKPSKMPRSRKRTSRRDFIFNDSSTLDSLHHSIDHNALPSLTWCLDKLAFGEKTKEHDRDSVVELTESEHEEEEEEEEAIEALSSYRRLDPFHRCCTCNRIPNEDDGGAHGSRPVSASGRSSTEPHACDLLDDNTSDLACSPLRPASSQSTSLSCSPPASPSPNPLDALKCCVDHSSHLAPSSPSSSTSELNVPKLRPQPHESNVDKCDTITKSTLPCVRRQSSQENNWPVSPSVHMIRTSLSHLTRLQDFNVVSLSYGFFSQVFKVIHFATKKVMVLKMNKEMSNRGNALKEIELLNKLNHRNIVAFMGTVVHGGTLHPLLEYINGGTLEQLVAQFYGTDIGHAGPVGTWGLGPVQYFDNSQAFKASNFQTIPIKRDAISARVHLLKDLDHTFLKLMADVARGMDYLHGIRYMHRDLASKNIFIRKLPPNSQKVKRNVTSTDPVQCADIDAYLEDYFDDDRLEAVIGDFGFAIAEPLPDGPKLSVVGSPYWMAPECFRKDRYNHKCDIYSFGVVCCELNWRTLADPDFLPRIDGNFVIDFDKLPDSKQDTPLAKVARLACELKPEDRPEFSQLLTMLEGELDRSRTTTTTTSANQEKDKSNSNDFPWRRGSCFELREDDAGNGDIFDQHLLRRRYSTKTASLSEN